jgi:hypothetical protein
MTLGHCGKGLLHDEIASVPLASGGLDAEGLPIQERDTTGHYVRLVLNVAEFAT